MLLLYVLELHFRSEITMQRGPSALIRTRLNQFLLLFLPAVGRHMTELQFTMFTMKHSLTYGTAHKAFHFQTFN